MRTHRITTAVLAAGLLGAAALPALAQDGSAADEATAAVTDWREERHAAFVAALADELELPADEVEEAVAAVRDRLREERQADRQAALEERLAAAVDAGDLTQEQADAILDAHASGALRRGGPGQGHGPGFGAHGGMGRGMGFGPRGPVPAL